jgi:hypothetical protein
MPIERTSAELAGGGGALADGAAAVAVVGAAVTVLLALDDVTGASVAATGASRSREHAHMIPARMQTGADGRERKDAGHVRCAGPDGQNIGERRANAVSTER